MALGSLAESVQGVINYIILSYSLEGAQMVLRRLT